MCVCVRVRACVSVRAEASACVCAREKMCVWPQESAGEYVAYISKPVRITKDTLSCSPPRKSLVKGERFTICTAEASTAKY